MTHIIIIRVITARDNQPMFFSRWRLIPLRSIWCSFLFWAKGHPLLWLPRFANLTLFSSKNRHVQLLCPSATPHVWHLRFLYFSPFAPSFITLASLSLIVRPFSFAWFGWSKLIPSLTKSNFYKPSNVAYLVSINYALKIIHKWSWF